jgi:hypothetical protein
MNAKMLAGVCSLHSEARLDDVFCGGVAARHKFSAMLVSMVLVAISSIALAEHEPNHRYTVSGYVLNEDESPIPATTVLISANGSGARGTTDSDGYFSLKLHLHDADLGRKLQIKTDHGEGTISATFDPGDQSSARVHHVNIVGGRLIEGKLTAGGKVPAWVFYLLGLSLLIIVVPVLRKSIKRLKKRLHPPAKTGPKKKPGPSRARPKSKKRKRR